MITKWKESEERHNLPMPLSYITTRKKRKTKNKNKTTDKQKRVEKSSKSEKGNEKTLETKN